MGAEQSSGRSRSSSGAAIRSRQNSLEDPPYATATQPIGDSPRRLLKTQSLSVADSSSGSALQRNSPKSVSMRCGPPSSSVVCASGGRRIITVNEGAFPSTEITDPANDPALVELQKLPAFYPIIRDTVRNPVMK
ncbi:hypothetical protein BIW11_08172, partial [Tropilaelaps mercedesae]